MSIRYQTEGPGDTYRPAGTTSENRLEGWGAWLDAVRKHGRKKLRMYCKLKPANLSVRHWHVSVPFGQLAQMCRTNERGLKLSAVCMHKPRDAAPKYMPSVLLVSKPSALMEKEYKK